MTADTTLMQQFADAFAASQAVRIGYTATARRMSDVAEDANVDIRVNGPSVESAARDLLDVQFPERAATRADVWCVLVAEVESRVFGPFASASDATAWADQARTPSWRVVQIQRLEPVA